MSTKKVSKDYLKINPPVAGQSYYCVSIVGPKFRQKSSSIQVMIRGGSFSTLPAAQKYAGSTSNKSVDVYCGQIGYWSSFVPEDANISDPNQELNIIMGEYIRHKIKQDLEYERLTKKRIDSSYINENDQLISSSGLGGDNNEDKSVEETVASLDASKYKQLDLDSETSLPNNEFACVSFISPIEGSTRSAYGLKVHGVFSTVEKCNELIKSLENIEKKLPIHIVSTGQWLKWDPSASELPNQTFSDPTLNAIMQGRNEQAEHVQNYKQEREEELMRQKIEEEEEEEEDEEEEEEEEEDNEDVIKVEEIE